MRASFRPLSLPGNQVSGGGTRTAEGRRNSNASGSERTKTGHFAKQGRGPRYGLLLLIRQTMGVLAVSDRGAASRAAKSV